MEPAKPSAPLLALILAVAVGLALFAGLGGYGLLDEEARYAEISREMLETGDWVTPRLNGVPYFEKPPALAWLGAGALAIGSRSPEWALRLVPALATLAAIVAIVRFGNRAGGPALGGAAGLALAVTPLQVGMARTFSTDAPFSAAMTVALALLGVEVLESRARVGRLIAAGLALAAAVLLRGPVALALYLPIAALAGRRDGPRITLRRATLPAALSLLLAAPWFLAESSRNPAFVQEFFVRQHFGRAGAPGAEKAFHSEPIWFYGPVVLWAFGAAALVIPAAIFRATRRLAEERTGRALRFALLAAGWTLLFFTLLSGKRSSYVLPAIPWLALCLGAAFEEARRCPRRARVLALGLVPAALGTLVAGVCLLIPFRDNAAQLGGATLVALVGALILSTAAPTVLLWRGRAPIAGLVGTGALAASIAIVASALSRFEEVPSLRLALAGRTITAGTGDLPNRRLALEMARAAAPEDVIACVGRYRPSVSFYTGRLTTVFGSQGELAAGIKACAGDAQVEGRALALKELEKALGGPRRIIALGSAEKLPNASRSLHELARCGTLVAASNRSARPKPPKARSPS
jgi:4-amino-4-deoxy-L-arabinose transferase-like glycosyltransferase